MDVSARPDAGQWVNSTPDSSLIAAIIAAGLPAPPSGLKTDGSFTRWGIDGSKPCWCVAHILNNGHLAASFGDWRTGSANTFRSWENGHPVDPNEAQRLIAELARRQKAAEAEDSATKVATAKRDAEIWQFLPESGDSEYLTRKQVGAHGIRYGSDHCGKFIAVPIRTITGKLTGFQRIYDDGRKHFPKNVEKKGAAHQIGSIEPGGVLYLVEG